MLAGCVAALAFAAPARAGVQSACEVTASSPYLYQQHVIGQGEIDCLSLTAGLVITVCLQRYEVGTGSWTEFNCARNPSSGSVTDYQLRGSSSMYCTAFGIAVQYRTHAHGVWGLSGQGDDWSPASALYCL